MSGYPKYVIFLCLLMIASSIALHAQMFKPNKTRIYQSLEGDVYTFCLFIDTDFNYWESDEVESYYKEFEKSQEWLIDQASYYGKEINFINDYFFRNKEVIYLDEVGRGYTHNILQKALEEMNYDDFEDFLEQNWFDFKENKLKILFFVKDQSRSHAYNYWSVEDVDIAIVYCQRKLGMMTSHYVISHEFLHQFGAWDLYYGKSQSREKAALAAEKYPGSIMISTSNRNGNEPIVDELTAWRIGWHYNFDSAYMEFTPVRKDRSGEMRSTRKPIKMTLGKKKDSDN